MFRLSLQYPPVKPMIAFQDCDFQFLLAARNLPTSPTRRPQLCKTIHKEIRKQKNPEPKASMLQCILENFGFREFMIIYIVVNFFCSTSCRKNSQCETFAGRICKLDVCWTHFCMHNCNNASLVQPMAIPMCSQHCKHKFAPCFFLAACLNHRHCKRGVEMVKNIAANHHADSLPSLSIPVSAHEWLGEVCYQNRLPQSLPTIAPTSAA